jgi:uncharacterized protein
MAVGICGALLGAGSMANQRGCWALMVAALLCAAPAGAALMADLYQATVGAGDGSEAAKSAAIHSALRAVLVKVTGRRSAAQDPGFGPLYSDAARYVQQFRGANGQIRIDFDSAAIDRWLQQNGQLIWGKERPASFVWLAIPNGRDTGVVVTRLDTPDIRRSLEAVASARGIMLLWPSAADLSANHLNYAQVVAGASRLLVEIARKQGADGVLIGRANGAAANAGVRWTFVHQGQTSEFTGNVEGVQRAADSYAANLAAGAPATPVAVDVQGIADLRAYAAVQKELESLSAVAHVEVLAMSGDTLQLRIDARGGSDSLLRALGNARHLQSVGSADSANALRLRFSP